MSSPRCPGIQFGHGITGTRSQTPLAGKSAVAFWDAPSADPGLTDSKSRTEARVRARARAMARVLMGMAAICRFGAFL